MVESLKPDTLDGFFGERNIYLVVRGSAAPRAEKSDSPSLVSSEMAENKTGNRRLSEAERVHAHQILEGVRLLINGCEGRQSAYVGFAAIRLCPPLSRRAEQTDAKEAAQAEQDDFSEGPLCRMRQGTAKRGSELDRVNAMDGYTEQNTRLVHHECHVKSQEEKGFA